MGQGVFRCKDFSEVLTLFSINIDPNTPKTPGLKFSIRGNVDQILKKRVFGCDFLAFYAKIGFSCILASTLKIQTQFLV